MIKTTIYFIVLMAVAYLFNYLHSIINNNNIKSDKKYYKRKYMSDCELNFYNKIKELENEEYKVIPQVNLATIIAKQNKSFQGELFRNIDFSIFDKNFQNLFRNVIKHFYFIIYIMFCKMFSYIFLLFFYYILVTNLLHLIAFYFHM